MVHDTLSAPVIVGGLNGSGTRVVAAVLQHEGFYVGQDHNTALDNLWFTLLLKRPRWYAQHAQQSSTDPEVQRTFGLLTKLMLGNEKLSGAEWRYLWQAALAYSFENRAHKSVWVLRRLQHMMRRRPIDLDAFRGWGWKEPHSHLYLPHLAHYYPQMRYIHTIRHGLDMAYSGNQEQVYKWGWVFDLPSAPPENEPQRALQFWIKANLRAVEQGHSLLGERFLTLNFDNLCTDPREVIAQLMAFLEIEDANIDELAKLPEVPSSKDRYLKQDNIVFSHDEIEVVRSFGFVVKL